MHRFFSAFIVVLAVAVFGQQTSAQTLTSSLFERYLETLREQAGIPGMSALVMQNGVVVWEQGFGRADVDTGERAAPYTPYLIGDLSQMFGATLLLRKCGEQGSARPDDPVSKWVSTFREPATLGHLAAHITPANTFKYDRARFAALTSVIEDAPARRTRSSWTTRSSCGWGCRTRRPGPGCWRRRRRIAISSTPPGSITSAPCCAGSPRRTRRPQRPDGSRRSRPDRRRCVVRHRQLGARPRASSTGSLGIGPNDDLLLLPSTRQFAWTRPAAHLPSGVGWFVQSYNGTQVVWQFGVVAGAYSSLIIKVPDRSLTFILLANSDRLSSPFALENGDVTTSVFAKLFLRLYVP